MATGKVWTGAAQLRAGLPVYRVAGGSRFADVAGQFETKVAREVPMLRLESSQEGFQLPGGEFAILPKTLMAFAKFPMGLEEGLMLVLEGLVLSP